MEEILTYQPELSKRLPEIRGNQDYFVFRNLLLRMEEVIEVGDLENPLIRHHVFNESQKSQSQGKKVGQKQIQKWSDQARVAFRCTLVLRFQNYSFRVLASHLADSPLYQHFCLLNRLDTIDVPSKSQLERYEKLFPIDLINDLCQKLIMQATNGEANIFNLKDSVNTDDVYIDATCLEANIHFPVDWVLLRDAVRSLMKSVNLIRREGLKHRMEDPNIFIKRMNQLSIKMTHSRNRKTRKKKTKKILRDMKKLVKKVENHALRHKQLLEEYWEESSLSLAQKDRILGRIDNILSQLPKAIKQAHERIIGERQVKNKDKILSLYESDVHVCVRGKASSLVEFGNTLVLGEQKQGLIVDWKLYKDSAPGEQKILKEIVEKMSENMTIQSVTTDRGMFSKSNKLFLKSKGIQDHTCPKSVTELQERNNDIVFRQNQNRRSQTEGRIGILKNKFFGDPMLRVGFEHRQIAVAWTVLVHNLWVLARMKEAKASPVQKAA